MPNDVEKRRSTPWSIVKRLLWQSALPGIAACAYAYWSLRGDSEQPFADVAGKFGVAFFFVSWFVGQYLRTAKQLDDARLLHDLSANVETIIQRVSGQPTGQGPAPPATDDNAPVRDTTARSLLDEARDAIQAGNRHSGLLAACVAFEHAVRAAASRTSRQPQNRGIHGDLQSLSGVVPREVLSELHGLREARNRLVHIQGDPPDAQIADSLWSSFRWAVAYLDGLGRDEPM